MKVVPSFADRCADLLRKVMILRSSFAPWAAMAAPCAARLHVYVPWRKWCGRQCERMRWPCAGRRRRSQENTEIIMVARLQISFFVCLLCVCKRCGRSTWKRVVLHDHLFWICFLTWCSVFENVRTKFPSLVEKPDYDCISEFKNWKMTDSRILDDRFTHPSKELQTSRRLQKFARRCGQLERSRSRENTAVCAGGRLQVGIWAVMVPAVAVDLDYVYFLEGTVYLCVQRFQ